MITFRNTHAPCLQEFINSATYVKDVGAALHFDDGDPPRPGYIYEGGLYIEYHVDPDVGGYWFLPLDRDTFVSQDRMQLEARLYVYGLDNGAFDHLTPEADDGEDE